MTEMSKYAPGTFSWVDLSTTSAAGAKTFYASLFGWTHEDMPAGDAGIYTMFSLRGKAVAGMSEMSADQQAQGQPPFWLSYVTVADATASAEKATTLGGTLMMPPMDVMDAGRMSLIQDPTGAVFAIWEPGEHIGAGIVNEHASLSWNELVTRDTNRATEFYTQLFDWGAEVQDMPNMRYTTFKVGERMNGGMMPMDEQWEGIPPHWMVYFAVTDVDASANQAKELGASIHVPPTDIPSIGRFSMVQDPQGAAFTIITFVGQ
jgi:predicted enzyme related to lactoylglutathione lyase